MNTTLPATLKTSGATFVPSSLLFEVQGTEINLALNLVDTEVLSQIADDFRARLFSAANKTDPRPNPFPYYDLVDRLAKQSTLDASSLAGIASEARNLAHA